MRLGAIDVGTNTTRLIVAEVVQGGYRDLERRLTFTRLGQGVDSNSKLHPEAVERTLKAIAEYCALCGEMGVGKIRVAGTSALRDATNPHDFLEGVRRLTGEEPEILSGEEEARLSFLGATGDMEPDIYLVCDIGGGSTEFVLGDTWRRDTPDPQATEGRRSGQRGVAQIRSISLDVGSVRLTERHLASDPPATEEMLVMEAAIDEALVRAKAQLGDVSSAKMVGVAGTITTMAAVHLGLEAYDPTRTHHLRMGRAHVDSLYHTLASLPIERRKALPSMPEGRADVIVAGASILSRAMRAWKFDEVTVSERDILDGLVIDMMNVKED